MKHRKQIMQERLEYDLMTNYFINDCLLQPMLHVNHPLLQFADITTFFLALLHCFPDCTVLGFRPELLRRPYILQDKS